MAMPQALPVALRESRAQSFVPALGPQCVSREKSRGNGRSGIAQQTVDDAHSECEQALESVIENERRKHGKDE